MILECNHRNHILILNVIFVLFIRVAGRSSNQISATILRGFISFNFESGWWFSSELYIVLNILVILNHDCRPRPIHTTTSYAFLLIQLHEGLRLNSGYDLTMYENQHINWGQW